MSFSASLSVIVVSRGPFEFCRSLHFQVEAFCNAGRHPQVRDTLIALMKNDAYSVTSICEVARDREQHDRVLNLRPIGQGLK